MKEEQFEKLLKETLCEEQPLPIHLTRLSTVVYEQDTRTYVGIVMLLSCLMILIENIVLIGLLYINPLWFAGAALFVLSSYAPVIWIFNWYKNDITHYFIERKKVNTYA